jgi:cystathionine gamma-synthase
VRSGIGSDQHHGAVVPPLHLSANFLFRDFGEKRPYDYTRSGNPTRDLLAEALAELEGGEGCIITSTGMSAVTLVIQLLQPGDLILAPHDCYGGTYRLLTHLARRGNFAVEFVDMGQPEALRAALAARPRLTWLETPSNPLLRITDIAAVTAAAQARGSLVAVDNTFLSPVLQQPLSHGADLVVHSTTKYLNGHSDVVGGAVIARDRSLHDELAWWANCLGLTGSPFDSYLTLRGLRTLNPRMRSHEENASECVALLSRSPVVSRVHYPGLQDHPGHATALRQQVGFGGMVSFEVQGGEPAVRAFLKGLTLFSLAESLGGVESLVAHPATMTHASMTAEARATAGIGDNLIRLSVGIEAARDLVYDIEQGLERALQQCESVDHAVLVAAS